MGSLERFHGALVDRLPCRDVESLAIGSAEGEVVGSIIAVVRPRVNDQDASAFVKDLDAKAGGDKQVSRRTDRHAVEVGMATIAGELGIKIREFVRQRTIPPDLIGKDVAPGKVGHIKQAVIRGKGDAVGVLKFGIGLTALAVSGCEVPDFSSLRIGIVNVALVVDDEIVRVCSFGNRFAFSCCGIPGADLASPCRRAVDSPVGAERDSVGFSGISIDQFFGAIWRDFKELAGVDVGKKERAVIG